MFTASPSSWSKNGANMWMYVNVTYTTQWAGKYLRFPCWIASPPQHCFRDTKGNAKGGTIFWNPRYTVHDNDNDCINWYENREDTSGIYCYLLFSINPCWFFGRIRSLVKTFGWRTVFKVNVPMQVHKKNIQKRYTQNTNQKSLTTISSCRLNQPHLKNMLVKLDYFPR